MKVLLSYLPLLGCAGAMVVCVRMMGDRSKDQTKPDAGEVAQHRAEVDRLRTELERSSRNEPAVREIEGGQEDEAGRQDPSAAPRTRPPPTGDVPSVEDGRRLRRERAKEARQALRRRQARARLRRRPGR